MDSQGWIQQSNPQAIKSLTWMVRSYGYLEIWDISIAAEFGLHNPQWGGWQWKGDNERGGWSGRGQRGRGSEWMMKKIRNDDGKTKRETKWRKIAREIRWVMSRIQKYAVIHIYSHQVQEVSASKDKFCFLSIEIYFIGPIVPNWHHIKIPACICWEQSEEQSRAKCSSHTAGGLISAVHIH